MKIRMWVRNPRLTGDAAISEDHELNIGKFNDFYIPAIKRGSEGWIVVTEDDGTETTLLLKY